ncbi:hypothetical protein J1N35_036788 [Gossypium stocksii]|uniref:Uncharacterized protein n=1 Tax=Gossypium stocksii TaxID=47602 RepID=A0A9D3UKP1_9ROSI|nr:hypothetical protein J1N35_036788 [Gossypium stocksii]
MTTQAPYPGYSIRTVSFFLKARLAECLQGAFNASSEGTVSVGSSFLDSEELNFEQAKRNIRVVKGSSFGINMFRLDSTVQGLGPFLIHKLSRLNIRSVIPSLMSTNCQEQEVNGMSVAEIFKLHGESFFRKKEPRRGCFEIREEGGETFISLLDMKRPFKPMKELDMEKAFLNFP